MIRRIVLLLVVFLNFVFIQNTVSAQGKYSEEDYRENLQRKVELNWIVPPKSEDKSAIISFTINKDGTISNVEILRNSGSKEFDENALDAIYKANPFSPLADNENAINVKFFFSPVFTSLTTNFASIDSLINPESNIIKVTNENPNIDLTAYAVNLQDKINSNWNPSKQKKQRNAIISISVDKDGTIENMKIQKSSDKKKFDNEILDSIMNSVPLDPLPDDLKAESKNIQLNFVYEKTKDKNASKKTIVANIKDQDGYDEYVEQVEKIISERLKDKKYFYKKDILLEMNIGKNGKLKYVKIQGQSNKDNFIKKEFNRKTLLTLQKTSFPSIPDEMGVENITLDYRILTQRKRLFRNFICDYVWNFFRTGLESFCVQGPANI